MSLVYFILITKYGVANLFIPACLWSLAERGRFCKNEGGLVPLSNENEMRMKVLKRRLLRLISDYAVDPVAAILVFACIGEIDWAAPGCLGWI